MKTTPSLMANFTTFHPAAVRARPRTFTKAVLGFVFASCLFLAGACADQTGTQPGCNNPIKPLPCKCKCPRIQGINPVDAASSDVMRDVQDLEVFGGVGEHQLNWTRYGHSRSVNGSAWFGDGHIWRHSYQWEMSSPGANQMEIVYPDGTDYTYTNNGGAWTGIASNPDLLTQSGTDYYLKLANGFTYHFAQLSSGSQTFYQMQNFTDSFGNPYTLTYDASNRVALISEPAGRWLRVTYQDVPVNQEQFTTLFAQNDVPPAGWTTVNVSNPTAFRYLRYFSTEPGSQDSFCNVAEVEFYDTAGNKLTGTPFGSSPAWNNGGSTFDKAFDGDPSTFFDYASRHFGFTGIDLGAGNAKSVGQIRFLPRAGYEGRMSGANGEGRPTGCRFEGSNVAPVTESVIAQVEAGYGSGGSQVVTRTVQYNYATFADPVLASGWLTLSGANYGDGSQATYTYQSVYAGQHPLLLSADDPRIVGNATRIKYEFWTSSYIMGAIYAEHDFASNQVLCKFEGEGDDNFTNSGRKITYANGGARHVVMGADNNETSSADELGNQTTYDHGSNNGFLVSETDPLNHTTSYARDAQGRVLSATYADNSAEGWTYDALGHALTHKDERGYTTAWTRDGNGRPTRIDYPDGGYETFTYNGFGEVLTYRQTNGGTESFAYDGRGLKTGWTDALNHTTTYGYDTNDLLVSVTDPLNHTTTYARNERGQVTQATYADNTATSYSYDVYDNQLSKTNELGKTWSATFDAYKRQITATDPLNRQTQYWYDQPGAGSSGCGGCGSGLGGTGNHLTTVILPSGKTTRLGYDPGWQRTSVTVGYNTSAAATTAYAYDAAGNVASLTDPRGKVTTYAYDSRNRRTSTTDPLSHVAARTYDAAGNVASDTRADNGVITYAYDSMNRCIQATDPFSQLTKMSYDAAGNLAVLTDARSNAYGFSYDLHNRKTRMSYPDGSHEDWDYDAAGNAATYTARAGQVRTFAYDARNRETDAAWNDGRTPEVTTGYDSVGQVLTLNNNNSALNYIYDDAGQLSSEKQNPTGGPGAKTVTYAYDADGNRAQLTNPDGTAVTYAYTTRNQVASVSLSGPPPLATYIYDLAGNRVTKSLENGTAATYIYDDANRLTSLTHQNGSTTLASFAYAYNAVNNRTSVTYASGHGDAYGYDATDQLTAVQYGATNPAGNPASPQNTQAYAYDAVGNRTSVNQSGATTAYSANNLNEYTQTSTISLAYDGNGNLTTIAGYTLGYDAQSRLIGATPNTPGNSQTQSIAYDARNRPVVRTVGSVTTYLFYDGWNLVSEIYGGSGGQTASYVYGAMVDELLVATNGGGTWYYHHDGLGSTAVLTNTSGQLVEQYGYDVYGQPTFKNAFGLTISGSAYSTRFLFTGREFLQELGMYDYRSRLYSPQTGRFLQTDSLRFLAADVNLYRYTSNDPVDYTDPTGGLAFAWHGRFCGPGWTNGGWEAPGANTPPWDIGPPLHQGGIDALDECCVGHDRCYAKCKNRCPALTGKDLCKCKQDCDRKLVGCAMKALIHDNPIHIPQNVLLQLLFGGYHLVCL